MNPEIGTPLIVDYAIIEVDEDGIELGEEIGSVFGVLVNVDEYDAFIIRRVSSARRHCFYWIEKSQITDVREI